MKKRILLCSYLEIICVALMLIIMSNKENIAKPVVDIFCIVFGIIMLAVLVALAVITIKYRLEK